MKNKLIISYPFIDIFKLIFALGIVALHTGFLLNFNFGYYVHSFFFRLGVPFFFLCSGFFLASKVEEKNKKDVFLKYLKKLFTIYLILSFVYLILNMIIWYLLYIYRKKSICNVVCWVTTY